MDVLLQPSELLLSCALKNGHDVLRTAGTDGIGSEHDCLASEGHDLAPEPLEVLTALLCVGQDVDGVPGRHCPDLLQTPPGLDPRIRRARRELMAQQ